MAHWVVEMAGIGCTDSRCSYMYMAYPILFAVSAIFEQSFSAVGLFYRMA